MKARHNVPTCALKEQSMIRMFSARIKASASLIKQYLKEVLGSL